MIRCYMSLFLFHSPTETYSLPNYKKLSLTRFDSLLILLKIELHIEGMLSCHKEVFQ